MNKGSEEGSFHRNAAAMWLSHRLPPHRCPLCTLYRSLLHCFASNSKFTSCLALGHTQSPSCQDGRARGVLLLD